MLVSKSLVGAIWFTIFLTACDVSVPAGLPGFSNASALEGTWKLVMTDNPGGAEVFYVFDAGGRLSEIRTVTGTVTVTARNVHKSVTLEGSRLRIVTSKDSVFEGELNAERTIATGKLATEITVGDVTATISNGAATLTKQ